MQKFKFYLLAAAVTLPALGLRLTGSHVAPLLEALIYGLAILGAAFLLSWAAEAAQKDLSQGAALAILALITILPEYAIDLYYTWQAGKDPSSEYVSYAAANMTGANRLLVGFAWPLIAILFWWRTGKRAVQLSWENSAEVAFLGIATLYSFTIPLRSEISLYDFVFLGGLFFAYLWRISKMPVEDEHLEGPAVAIGNLPRTQRRWSIGLLALFAAFVILLVAEPFAEALIHSGESLGIDEFLLIQWLAPLASEAPEVVICVLFVLKLKPTAAIGALVSSKINQWTLLVGMIPLVYSLAAGRLAALPLGERQNEEFFLTAAQSLFAVALLLRLRLSLWGAFALLIMFIGQFTLSFIYRNDEPTTIAVLTAFAWLYVALAAALFLWNRRFIDDYIKIGILNRPAPELEAAHREDAPQLALAVPPPE